MTRQYSSISVETTLASTISSSATTMTVAAGTGSALLGGVTLAAGNVDQFTVALDPDTTNEEIVFITASSSDTFTITRARAGTSGVQHSAGATVKHVLTSDDLNAFKASISPVTNVGFAGSTSGTTTVQATAVAGTTTLTLPAATDTLVGKATTDTLTNKTINLASNTLTATSAQIATAVSDETGSGSLVFGTSPTLTTPTINDARQNLTLNAQTGTTYTLVLTDNGRLVTLSNASPITVTVPTNASVAYATGAIINVQQIGAGQVTIQGAGGVTVTSTGATSTAPKLRAQYSAASIIKTGTDSWTVIGDLS
jgi:hypothetical protein